MIFLLMMRKIRESIITRQSQGIGDAQGPPGTSSNIASATPSSHAPGTVLESEELETDFAPPSTRTTKVTEAPGEIQRLSIGVVVHMPQAAVDPDPSGPGTTADSSNATQEMVESIVKQAVGFDSTRNDEIYVAVSEFNVSNALLVEQPTGVSAWRNYEGLIRDASLGVASLVALVVGFVMLRKLRPITVPQSGDGSLTPETAERLSTLSTQAHENPEAIASAISAWLDDSNDSQSETPQQAAA